MAVTTPAFLTAALELSFPKLVPFRFKLQRRKAGTSCQDHGSAQQIYADTSAVGNSMWLARVDTP